MRKKENISIYNFWTGGDISDKQNKDYTCGGINNSGGSDSIGNMLFKQDRGHRNHNRRNSCGNTFVGCVRCGGKNDR